MPKKSTRKMPKKIIREMANNPKRRKGEVDQIQTEADVRHRRRSARLAQEELPNLSPSTSALKSHASDSVPPSSDDEESNEAMETLLSMKTQENRERKRRRSREDVSISKKKKVAALGDIRPSACLGTYCSFMQKLQPKLKKWHWDAYKGCNFEHYVFFGPPARDRRALEYVLSHYTGETDEFSFPDPKSGSIFSVKFDEEWVHTHTGFPIDGELIYGNRDPRNRLWRQYFEDKKEMLKAKPKAKAKAKATPEAGSMRRYVEELLETLVESSDNKDIEDFVLLQILYQCATIWCPNSSQGIPRQLFQYVDSIERVKTIAWGKFIFDETKRGIQIAVQGMRKPGVTYVPGCMPLIPLWYFEMTGIKKPALNLRWKPPMTNWVRVGGTAGSLRMETIVSKAKKASIKLEEKPISLSIGWGEKYPQREPSRKKIEFTRFGKNRSPTSGKQEKKRSNGLTKEQTRPRKMNEEEKQKAGKQEKVMGRPKSSSVGYILSQHIADAFSREDEIDKLTPVEQIHFWRNTANINWKLLHAVKRSKRLQWDACSQEIHRLNKKLERYEGVEDLIDPEDLKKNVRELMSQNDSHKGYAQRKIRKSFDSNDRGDMGDDGICFDYDDVSNIGKEASHIAEAVAQTEKEAEKGECQEMEVAYVEKAVHSEEDKKEEEREDEKKEEEQEMEKKEEAREDDKKEEEQEMEKEEEEKEAAKEEWQEMEVENVGKAVASEEDKDQVQVYRKRSKKLVSRGIRGPSTRKRTRSHLVRTPFTEGKKKDGRPEIINISPHKDEEREKIRFYCKPDECTWDILGKRKIKKKEEALLKLLNEGIPNVDDFSIRVIDSEGTFVHNYRVPQHIAAKLTPDENRWLSQFCNETAHQSRIIVKTLNSSVDSTELLYLLRGGRIDDHVMEALVDRLSSWLERPEIGSVGMKYGVVSAFFCHSIYAVNPDYAHLYTSFIQKHVAANKSVLLIPLVRHDHWHVVEVRLDEDVIKHYSSAGHSAYLEPVNKVIDFMDHMKAGFDPNNVWKKYRYEAVPCEQQRGMFDCGLFVPLYITAIIQGTDTSQVTNPADEADVIRAKLAAELLIEGWEQKNYVDGLQKDG